MRVYTKAFKAVLCAGMVSVATPASAGFEFAPVTPSPAASLDASSQASEEMPSAPMEPVSQEPIGAAGAAALPLPGSVVPNPSQGLKTSAAPHAEGVYIRRVKPGANEPVNTGAFLKATANQEPISLAPRGPQTQAGDIPAEDQALVINPYPLGNANAVHTNQILPVEQAMMEQGGTLRPVGAPGQARNADRPRQAALSGRANSVSRAMDVPVEPAVPFQSNIISRAAATGGTAITPIPGGEGPPLKLAGRVLSAETGRVPAAVPATVTPRSGAALPAPADISYVPRTSSDAVQASANVLRAPSQDYAASRAPAPASVSEGARYYPQGAPLSPARVSGQAYTEAVGFGRDLPLALALSQIVPPDFSFSFAQDVNVGQTVSWKGGKPWDEVLNDMLAPRGMRASIENNQVVIVNARS